MDLNSILSAVERIEISAKLALETAKEIRAEIDLQESPKKGLSREQKDSIITARLKRIKRKQ